MGVGRTVSSTKYYIEVSHLSPRLLNCNNCDGKLVRYGCLRYVFWARQEAQGEVWTCYFFDDRSCAMASMAMSSSNNAFAALMDEDDDEDENEIDADAVGTIVATNGNAGAGVSDEEDDEEDEGICM